MTEIFLESDVTRINQPTMSLKFWIHVMVFGRARAFFSIHDVLLLAVWHYRIFQFPPMPH